ncbi:MAG: zinc ribbon domain-containing protein [Candidatus Xenobiia bacterium LiM19]
MCSENSNAGTADDLFAYTRSAGLNDLIDQAKKIYEDDFDPDFFIDDYREKMEGLRELTEKTKSFHADLMKIQEDSPLIREQSERMERGFSQMLEGLRIMEEFMDYNEKEKITEGLSMVKKANEEVFSAIDLIKEEDARLPRHSKSPYVHELIRIAKGVKDKGFPREALKERLDWMVGYCENIYKDFQIYKSSRCETEAIQAKLPDMEAALSNYREGLKEIEEFFVDDNNAHLEKGIDLVRSGSDGLVEAYELIHAEIKGFSSKLCVKCGDENLITAKFCRKCSAILPEGQGRTDLGNLNIKVAEDSRNEDDRVYCSNILVLMEAVNEYRAGRSSKDALLKVINWMDEKIREGSQALASMETPASFQSAEEQETVLVTKEMLEDGTSRLGEALAIMKQFFDTGDEACLAEGLEIALQAQDTLYQVQERSKFAMAGE